MQSKHIADPLIVSHHPAEQPLFIITLVLSIVFWLLLIISIFGIIYALLVAVFYFILHLLFIFHIKGSAIKLGPDQFPDLYNRVVELCQRTGIYDIPDAYIMQAGGTLNAMATKFLRSKMIILYTDLLEACGTNKAARDMIIGHEIGHIQAGHLRWMWLIFPGLLVPFLGSALHRSRELTCDRYGVALCGDKKGALIGLAILAGGGKVGPHVNLHAFVNQKLDLNTGFMTIGKWLSTYPPLSERIAAIEPMYASNLPQDNSGAVRALGILSLVFIVPVISALIITALIIPVFHKTVQHSSIQTELSVPAYTDTQVKYEQVQKDFEKLSQLVRFLYRSTGQLPETSDYTLSKFWQQYRPGIPEPMDPYDGNPYGYQPMGEGRYLIWSVGPDGTNNTQDDLIYDDTI